MNELYIFHQTQLGDHILCYPIIRYYSYKFDKIFVFATNKKGQQHIDNLRRLYSSLSNVELLVLYDSIACSQFLSNISNKLIIGHEDFREELKNHPDTIFDEYYYRRAQLPLDQKWTGLYLKRNIDIEKNIFENTFGLKENEEFIFLQEDPSRNLIVNRKYIDNSLKIIEASKYPNVNIFDFLYTIKKAKETHVINSCFLTLIDMMNLKDSGLFYHKYVRPSKFEQPHLKLNWKIID